MRIAMWTDYLHGLSPEDAVKTFAERGWRWLELSDEHAHELLRRGDPVKTGEALRAFAQDHGVTIPQGHFILSTDGLGGDAADTAPADDALFEDMMEQMKRWVDLFAAIGIQAGVYHHGGYDLAQEGWSDDRILARRQAGIERVCSFARGTVTQVCIENLPDYSPGYEHILPLVEFLPGDEIGVCLDTGHANMADIDCADFVRAAGARLRALHVHDSIDKYDHILPYGRGTVNWPAFLAALREINYTGLFNWEIPGETQRCPLHVRLLKLDYVRRLSHWMLDEERIGVTP